ncbi:Hypothetical protein PROPJV5_0662 [Propionibacterium ruminifibrarum]|uniref:Lipoprotein n=1 Tax=Propionibacterium ruminifibrarum TaxID=1962131 RepID=A0A375HYQ9_9ACTN|nr:hypothetical protein [Propionibacterium ruminifibrarum]SPF67703.1 Hypothetical protein PROPJV5_0662 [Propionibacterium ruminifibrarum]
MNITSALLRLNRLRTGVVLGAAGALLSVAACSAGAAAPTQSPAVTSPAGGRTATTIDQEGVRLTELGFRNGPADFTVPAGLVLTGRVDQDNVVTLLMDQGQGRRVHDHLMATLPGAGWTIEGSSDDSIVFSTSEWEGALTVTAGQAGLTLRRLETG